MPVSAGTATHLIIANLATGLVAGSFGGALLHAHLPTPNADACARSGIASQQVPRPADRPT
ncbi:MAG TPA: hypothetical protein VFH80_03420 [Solirubrobacteraceae bacterium]|nr:hypothetical protein [Solirubrobacteraceae bacterium]